MDSVAKARLRAPSSIFPGMQVRWRTDSGPDSGGGDGGLGQVEEHRLRWETLSPTKGRPLPPFPDPTILEVITYSRSVTHSRPSTAVAASWPSSAVDRTALALVRAAAAGSAPRRFIIVAGVECALHSAAAGLIREAPLPLESKDNAGGGDRVLGHRFVGQPLGAVYSCAGPPETPLTIVLEGRPAALPIANRTAAPWRREAGFAAVPMHGRLWHVVEDPPRDFVGQLTLSLLADGQPVDIEQPVQVRGVCGDTCLAGEAGGDPGGRWRTVGGNGNEAVRNEWVGGGGCLYAAFDGNTSAARSNAALLSGTTIAFIGNSHSRNLFRCAADVISGGESRRSAGRCPGPACLACSEFFPQQGEDRVFRHAGANVSLEFYWTAAWDLPVEARGQCGVRRAEDGGAPAGLTNETRRCVAKAVGLMETYVGSRIGLDLLRAQVHTSF